MFTPIETLKTLPFRIPKECCCNCGTTENVTPSEVILKTKRYFAVAGIEYTCKIELPFCFACDDAANRLRKNLLEKALPAFGLFWIFLGVLLFFADRLPQFVAENMLWFAMLPASLLTGLYYSRQRAKPPATSFSQPVHLKSIRTGRKGDLEAICLGFTNHSYAKKFAELNTDFCESKVLSIKLVS